MRLNQGYTKRLKRPNIIIHIIAIDLLFLPLRPLCLCGSFQKNLDEL